MLEVLFPLKPQCEMWRNMPTTKNQSFLFVFWLCAFSTFYLNLIGQIYLVELFLLGYWILSSGLQSKKISYYGNPSLKELNLSLPSRLIVLIIIGEIISDFYNHSSLKSTSKGFALLFFTLISLLALKKIIGVESKKFVYAYFGLVLSGLLSFFFEPSPYARQFIWKFGFSNSINLFVVLLLTLRKKSGKPYFSPWILMLLSFVNLLAGTRSAAVFTALTFIVFKIQVRGNSKGDEKKLKRRRFILVIGVIGLLVSLSFLYSAGARSGLFGNVAQQKYLTQASGKLGIIIGGRPETVFSAIAILKSPIIGFGSGAPITVDILDRGISVLSSNGYKLNLQGQFQDYLTFGTIPEHSYLLGSWVNWGFLSLPFWIWCIKLSVQSLIRPPDRNYPLRLLVIYVAVNTLWSIFFSPFGATARFQLALSILLLMYDRSFHTEET